MIFKNIVIVFIAYYVNQSALLIHVYFPVYLLLRKKLLRLTTTYLLLRKHKISSMY